MTYRRHSIIPPYLLRRLAESAEAEVATPAQFTLRTDESFRNRELMAQQRMDAQLKPVAETLAKFQEHVAALEKTLGGEFE